jgi:threonine dehydrogenase-like Zn-dependent dehydrogenase
VRATVFHSIGDTCLDDVPEPPIEQATGVIVRTSTSAIWGNDVRTEHGDTVAVFGCGPVRLCWPSADGSGKRARRPSMPL